MENDKSVMLDTSFCIRLLGREDPLHRNAKEYYKYFLDNDYALCLSTIAVAEFCVKDEPTRLPLQNVKIVPFNFDHAVAAGRMIAKVNETRKQRGVAISPRVIIPNDTKMFAQTQFLGGEAHYATSDTECGKIYSILRDAGLATFSFIDINRPCKEHFGLLFAPEV